MNKEKYRTFTAGVDDDGKRADRIIRQFIPGLPLGGIYKAFRKGLIRVNGRKADSALKICEGDSVQVYHTLLKEKTDKKERIGTSDLSKQILFENDDILAINKKKGQLVHGGNDALDESVRRYLEGKLPESLSFRPGPLHRLDRNTSGLIFFSRSLKGAREFSESLQGGDFTKYYLALLDGTLKNKVLWVDNLQRDEGKKKSFVSASGDEAVTTVYPLRSGKEYSLALVAIETGRTHQIRVQSASHGHPLAGDGKYGGSRRKEGYFLHSLMIRAAVREKQPCGKAIMAMPPENELKALAGLFPRFSAEELKKVMQEMLEDQ